jgi:hypothetical protein
LCTERGVRVLTVGVLAGMEADEAGCQCLRYTVMDLDTFDILQDGRVPLPKKVTLSWLGWTAEGVSNSDPACRVADVARLQLYSTQRASCRCLTGSDGRARLGGYRS